jgi:hypothetical protein
VPNITSAPGSTNDGEIMSISGSSCGADGPNVYFFDDFEVGEEPKILTQVEVLRQ